VQESKKGYIIVFLKHIQITVKDNGKLQERRKLYNYVTT